MDYGSSRWKKKSLHILRMDKYQDRWEQRFGKRVEATVVHHIYPSAQYPEYEYCDWNLISVSRATHNKLENRMTGELTQLGLELMERTVPYEDWRHNKWATS